MDELFATAANELFAELCPEEPLLAMSPKSYFIKEFIENPDTLFTALNVLDGWKVNTYQDLPLNRQTVVFADDNIIADPDKFPIPAIWGKDVKVLPWPECLLTTKVQIEEHTGVKYTIALGNRYNRPKDAIAFHSDNEEFGNTQSIASLSLGVPRTFTFRAKFSEKMSTNETKTLTLNHGSFLFMGENCQENYKHGMRKEQIIEDELYKKTRINVTFRVWNY